MFTWFWVSIIELQTTEARQEETNSKWRIAKETTTRKQGSRVKGDHLMKHFVRLNFIAACDQNEPAQKEPIPPKATAYDCFNYSRWSGLMHIHPTIPRPSPKPPKSRILHHNAMKLYVMVCVSETNSVVYGAVLLYIASCCVRDRTPLCGEL